MRQQYVRGPRGLLLPLRRDCPEILLPDSADTVAQTTGASGTFSAWSQTVTAAQFGTKELVVAGMVEMANFTATVAADANPALIVGFQVSWELYHGTSDPSTAADRFLQILGEGVAMSKFTYTFSGNTDNTTDLIINCPVAVLKKITPKRIGPSARIAFRSASNDATTYGFNVMPVAYDADKLNWHVPMVPDEALCLGYTDARHERSDFVTLATPAAGTWANGSYADFTVNGQAELDADYYVTEAVFQQDPAATARGTNMDIAVLPKGGTAGQDEVIQSRAALIRNAVAPPTAHWEFPMGPFVAYKGEKLRGRVRRGAAAAVNHISALHMTRIAAY